MFIYKYLLPKSTKFVSMYGMSGSNVTSKYILLSMKIINLEWFPWATKGIEHWRKTLCFPCFYSEALVFPVWALCREAFWDGCTYVCVSFATCVLSIVEDRKESEGDFVVGRNEMFIGVWKYVWVLHCLQCFSPIFSDDLRCFDQYCRWGNVKVLMQSASTEVCM